MPARDGGEARGPELPRSSPFSFSLEAYFCSPNRPPVLPSARQVQRAVLAEPLLMLGICDKHAV